MWPVVVGYSCFPQELYCSSVLDIGSHLPFHALDSSMGCVERKPLCFLSRGCCSRFALWLWGQIGGWGWGWMSENELIHWVGVLRQEVHFSISGSFVWSLLPGLLTQSLLCLESSGCLNLEACPSFLKLSECLFLHTCPHTPTGN